MRPDPRHPLSAKVLTVARANGVILALLSLVIVEIMVAIVWLTDPDVALGLSVAFAVLLAVWFVGVRPALMARHWRYELLDDELYLQQGLVTLRRIKIPYLRIQNVDTSQGPIGRFFGVSSVTVSTAGGMSEIPILDDDAAEQLRQHIDQRARGAQQEVVDAG